MIISIEGNIGIGKSTLLDNLKDILDAEIHPEKLDDAFLKCLGDFDKDPQRYAPALQEHIMNMRIALAKETHGSDKIHIIERSVISDVVFSYVMCGDGFIDQRFYHQYVVKAREELEERPLDLILYLRTDPEVSFRRQLGRAREEESNVSLDYLTKLSRSHDIWIPMHASYHHTFYEEIDYNTFVDPEEIANVIRKRIR
jgi:deoxycitidine kinase/deoxyguanosine kinase